MDGQIIVFSSHPSLYVFNDKQWGSVMFLYSRTLNY